MFITFLERERGMARRAWQQEGGARREERRSLLLGRLSVPIKSARRGQNVHCNPTIKNADLFGGGAGGRQYA